MLYDEPGRCGGIDSHSHHYRIVRDGPWVDLLVRHGGGDERLHLSLFDRQIDILGSLDSNARYWLLNAIYHAYRDGERLGSDRERHCWQDAAREKRIKTRKGRGTDSVTVWIKPKPFHEEG